MVAVVVGSAGAKFLSRCRLKSREEGEVLTKAKEYVEHGDEKNRK